MRRSVWMAVVVLAAGTAAWAQAPVRRDVSPLSELNPLVEADEMARLGMVELLEALRQQLSAAGDETRARKVQVALLTCQARLAADEDQRDELLQKAVAVQREVLADAEKKTDRTSAEELAYLKGRIKLAELLGQEQAEPHVRRIVYLMASEADLKDLNALAKEAAQLCGGAYAAVDRLRQSVNLDARDSILLGPQVEQLLDDVRYKSAWMYFREAISLPAGEMKTRRLNDAKANVEKFALGDNEQGVKYWSLLLVGMCLRELSEHELAAKYLEQADVVMAQSVDLRLQAKFEKARNAIEWGASLAKGPKANAQAGEAKFADAVKLVDEFNKAGYAQGKDWELTTDLKRVMLLNYLYERWASVTSDEKKKAEYLAASQKPFAELIVKFADPGEQTFLLNMIAMKYRGKTDYNNLGSVVLLAMGLREIRSGGDLPLGDKLLSMVLGREDEVSKMFRPLALFNLGMLKNSQRLNDDAARYFMRVAKEYPDHAYAYQSSLFAVISYNGVFQERRETGQLIDAELRRSFIQAMELLLGNKDWSAKPEVQQWQFQLGWQYDQLAQQVDEGPERNALMTKAVEAYQKVPATASNHMAAASFSLRLEVELLGTGGEDGQIKTKARDLISRLATFSAEAMRQCRKMTDPAQKELADDLRNWAAMAAYAAAKAKYEKLEDHVGAMVDLNAIEGNADWATTDVAPAVVEYKIRKLVDEDKTRQAIDEVEKFRQKYPARAADLIRLVVSQIQSSIDRLKDDPARQDDLRKYKEAYLEFANDLYARAEEQKLSPEEMVPMKRLLADALVSNAS
ncbi:MAG TPA: tetratricopeptide repeat protein, partial [Phycisphaerae bacterium]|nr:tetratricopeptide repeat protein [Phycisphaerae bacterium]